MEDASLSGCNHYQGMVTPISAILTAVTGGTMQSLGSQRFFIATCKPLKTCSLLASFPGLSPRLLSLAV